MLHAQSARMSHVFHADFLHGPFLFVVVPMILLEGLYLAFVLKHDYDLKITAASLGVALGNILTKPITSLVFLLTFPFVSAFAPWHVSMNNVWAWIAAFIATEFAYYWAHRFGHTIRWMWATHSVHHSSPVYALPSAVRLGWTNALSGEWLCYLPLMLLGFPPAMITVLLTANLAYQFFLHTELSPKWGLLEAVLNTPAHHRIHHASNDAYLDRNFGGVLIVFDRLFGTFAADDGREPVRFGLTTPVNSSNPFVIAFAEWFRLGRDLFRSRSPREAFENVFGPPK